MDSRLRAEDFFRRVGQRSIRSAAGTAYPLPFLMVSPCEGLE
jgi:hypothetical protein